MTTGPQDDVDDSNGWSVDLDVDVDYGTRRVSLVPLPDGRLVVLDATGGGTYGLLLLGVLTPLGDADDTDTMPRRHRAHNHHGEHVGDGDSFTLMGSLFAGHPLRDSVMAHGIPKRD